MGSIYKALMRAVEERQVERVISTPPPLGNIAPNPDNTDAVEDMVALFQAIESLPISAGRKIVQFFGSHDGNRARALAREFALKAAETFDLGVVLAEGREPEARIEDRAPFGSLFKRIQERGPRTLGVAKPSQAAGIRPNFQTTDDLKPLWAPNGIPTAAGTASSPWSKPFDLVVVSASMEQTSGASVVCPNAEALVLVFESEDTASSDPSRPKELGLTYILELIGQGLLLPQQSFSYLGNPLLLLTAPSTRHRP